MSFGNLDGMLRNVKKRNGELVLFDAEKLNRWGEWASERCNVSWSGVVLEASKGFVDGISTKAIQESLIETCVNRRDTGHSRMAARLLMGVIYKEAYGTAKVPAFSLIYKNMVADGYWADLGYSDEELAEVSAVIDNEVDLGYEYATVRQFYDKYAVSAYGRCLESPQVALMATAMANTQYEENRAQSAAEAFVELSKLRINLPTPTLVGQKTPQSGSPSCCVISGGDDTESIGAACHVAYTMTTLGAGIGAELYTRSKGDPIRGGTITHLGKDGYFKLMSANVKANKQHCYSDDTDILTASGWKPFAELSEDDLVAQVTDGMGIEFVKPISLTVLPYTGEMVSFKKQGIDLLVTPNHRMAYRSVKYDDKESQTSDGYVIETADEFSPRRTTALDFGGRNTSGDNSFTAIDRLYVAFCADGCKYKNKNGSFSYKFGFKKDRKVRRLVEILESAGVEYTIRKNEKGVTTIRVLQSTIDMNKGMVDFDYRNMGSSRAYSILREISYWDSHIHCEKTGSFEFSSRRSVEIESVQMMCSIAGVKSYTGVKHRCYVYLGVKDITGDLVKKTFVDYSGTVYCAEVPTGKLVIRRGGYTLVCGNTRGGSATMTINAHDPEINRLLRYKSQRVHADSRIDTMDYSLASTKLFTYLVGTDGDWMLVSKFYAPELHELQYSGDPGKYIEEYIRVKNDPDIPKTIVKARDVASVFAVNRSDVGRIYKTFLTNINNHTPFKDKIRLSNLCQEICLPTSYLSAITSLYQTDIKHGEVALCFLASIVVGRCDEVSPGFIDPEAYYRTAYQTCKIVDNTIDQATYPFPLIEKSAKARRSVGIGMTDVAHWMARNGYKYDTEEGRNALHRIAELHSFALHKASVQLAKERGACEWIDRTKYADEIPWLPIDTYSREIDRYHSQELLCDWEWLRGEIKKYGVRFSVHEAFMPVESSSVFTASTNSILPVRDVKVFKRSPKGSVYFEAPGIEEFGQNYQNAYDISMKDMAIVYGIFQKFCGQSISADFYQDVSGNKQVSLSEIYELMTFCDDIGIKTWYYMNSKVVTSKTTVDADCENDEEDVQIIIEEDDGACEACTL